MELDDRQSDKSTMLRDSALRAGDRVRLTPVAAQRHSVIVRNLRLAIPAAAAGLLATYAFSATPPKIDPTFAREFSQLGSESGNMRLDRPRYIGEDLEGRPFEIAASAAEQDLSRPDVFALENPEAFGSEVDGESVRIQAEAGLMDVEQRRLDLTENVRLRHQIGGSQFVLNTDAAEVDLETNTVHSNVGITGAGDRGTVAADTATVYQDDSRLVLTGNVRLRLNPTSQNRERDAGLR